jgi:hypothetical protein
LCKGYTRREYPGERAANNQFQFHNRLQLVRRKS